MAAVTMPGRAKGKATVKKASNGRAPKVAATSIGRRPMASNECCKGCTANGKENTMEPNTKPLKVNDNKPQPMACVHCPNQPCGPMATSR